jgi:hypothetical protein
MPAYLDPTVRIRGTPVEARQRGEAGARDDAGPRATSGGHQPWHEAGAR